MNKVISQYHCPSVSLLVVVAVLNLWLATIQTGIMVQAHVYLKETFDTNDALQRWTTSQASSDYGRVRIASSRFAATSQDKGLQTMDDNRFYAVSTRLIDAESFYNKNKTLVIQYGVQHEQSIDCGGGYIKLLPESFIPETFDGHSPYNIMFGPDICGSNKRVHVILRYQNTTISLRRVVVPPSDQLTHLYTLIIKPDQTFKVLIDLREEAAGHIVDEFDSFPPTTIPDPNAVKPADWDDNPTIIDETDVKPSNYDDIPQFIPLPAQRPSDWNDDEDGEWTAPVEENPLYKGPWQPRRIPNPAYKGVWHPPDIPNPEYVIDPDLAIYHTSYVGFDIWQVKAGTIFKYILITDDEAYAHDYADSTFIVNRPLERAAKERIDEEEEEQQLRNESSEYDDDDEYDDDEDDVSHDEL